MRKNKVKWGIGREKELEAKKMYPWEAGIPITSRAV